LGIKKIYIDCKDKFFLGTVSWYIIFFKKNAKTFADLEKMHTFAFINE